MTLHQRALRRRRLPVLTAAISAILAIGLGACGPSGMPPGELEHEPDTEPSATFRNPFGITLGQEPEPMDLIELPFEIDGRRATTFGGFSFEVTGALVRNVAPYGMFDEPVPGEQLYAYVDLLIEPVRVEDGSEPSFATLTLQLYSGELMPRFEPPGLDDPTPLAGTDQLTYEVWFPVPDGDALDGAALRWGAEDDAPAHLPLGQVPPNALDPRALALDGTATGPGAGYGNPIEWSLRGGLVSRDRPPGTCCPETGDRAGRYEAFLSLSLSAILQPGTSQGFDYATGDEVRLVVDDAVIEPFDSSGGGSVDEGESTDIDVHFVIPVDANRLTVEVGSGSDPGAIEIELRRALRDGATATQGASS